MTTRRRKWIFIVGGLLLLLVLVAMFSDGQTEGEKFKAQLRAKGEKISFAELGLTNAHKADYMAGFKAFYTLANTNPIRPGEFEMMRFVTPQKMIVSWKRDFLPPVPVYRNQPKQSLQPGTNTWEDLSEQLTIFKDHFIFLHELLENPPTEIGRDYRDLTNWGQFNFPAERNAACWLRSAVLSDLHDSRHDSALKNLHTLISFIQLHKNDYTLVNQMVHAAIGGLALTATWEAWQADGWTEKELARLQKAWETIDFSKMVENGLVGDRATVDAAFNIATTNRSQFLAVMNMNMASAGAKMVQGIGVSAWHAFFAEQDEMCALSMIQRSIELCRRQGQEPWWRLKKEGDQAMEEFEAQFGSLFKFRFWLSARIIPNSRHSLANGNRQEVARALAIVAIALKRYQLRHGQFPAELNALSPEFLKVVPQDRMTLEPLRYRVNTDGTFILYSVGENGRDDGGNSFSASTNQSKTVPRRNWLEGDDIIWPLPASDEDIKEEAAQAVSNKQK